MFGKEWYFGVEPLYFHVLSGLPIEFSGDSPVCEKCDKVVTQLFYLFLEFPYT